MTPVLVGVEQARIGPSGLLADSGKTEAVSKGGPHQTEGVVLAARGCCNITPMSDGARVKGPLRRLCTVLFRVPTPT
jgi:hypothetical protein